MLKNLLRTAIPVKSTLHKSHSQPLQLPETPQCNWGKLAVDLKGPLPSGESILVITDYKSRYPIAISLKSTTTDTIIKQMNQVFRFSPLSGFDFKDGGC